MTDETALERELSDPTPEVIDAMRRIQGDILILGAGGKMGPTLAQLAVRAGAAAQNPRQVIAVARFGNPHAREAIEAAGARCISADLLDLDRLADLPDAPNVIFMAGQKFGTTGDSAGTWATNALLPGMVAYRYRTARFVVFSTGNVYPFWPSTSEGPTEQDPVGPIGEYAQSALARERIFEYAGERYGTRSAILRVNYAIEPRYGVLRDIADRVRQREPIDLAMGRVNLIWQRDANAIALRALEHAAAPPFVLNVTGPAVSVRSLAERFGARWNIAPLFRGTEEPSALLSNATLMERVFGPAPVNVETMIDRIVEWVDGGGRSLGKPTRYEERRGAF